MEFNLKKVDLDKLAEKVREVNSPEVPTGQEGLVRMDLSLEVVKPRFLEYMGKIDYVEKEAQALEVKDDSSREVAANLGAGAKKLIKAIEARKLEVTEQARNFVSSVNGLIGKFTDRLKTAAKIAGDKELSYLNLQEMKRREQEKLALEATAKLQKQIDKEAKKKGIESVQVLPPVVPETQTTARTEAGITSFTVTSWDFEIIDDSDVPRIYTSADPKKIREAIKNGVREIRGCRIFEKTEIRHRS